VGENETDHRFGDDAGARNMHEVGTLINHHGRLARIHVNRTNRCQGGGDGFEGGADYDGRAVGESAFESARAIRVAREFAVADKDLILYLRSELARILERRADFDALDGMDAHNRLGETTIELAVPMNVRAETDRHVERDGFNHAACGF